MANMRCSCTSMWNDSSPEEDLGHVELIGTSTIWTKKGKLFFPAIQGSEFVRFTPEPPP